VLSTIAASSVAQWLVFSARLTSGPLQTGE
jgi:hypothetical protein